LDFRQVATWFGSDQGVRNTNTGRIDTSFPKGDELASWLELTGVTPRTQFPIQDLRGSIRAVDARFAQRWAWTQFTGCNLLESLGYREVCGGLELTQYFSFNTPVGAPEDTQCGRVVFSDLHVREPRRSGNDIPANRAFPSTCPAEPLSAQERILLFMLFDLARCVVPDKI
jgi:hypothetical protein